MIVRAGTLRYFQAGAGSACSCSVYEGSEMYLGLLYWECRFLPDPCLFARLILTLAILSEAEVKASKLRHSASELCSMIQQSIMQNSSLIFVCLSTSGSEYKAFQLRSYCETDLLDATELARCLKPSVLKIKTNQITI